MDVARIHAAARRQRSSRKGKFNVWSFLKLVGIREWRRSGQSLMIRCPMGDTNHRHGDRNPSFALGLTGAFICFGCHIQGGYEDLFRMYGLAEDEIEQCFIEQVDDEKVFSRGRLRSEIRLPDEYESCVRQTGVFDERNVMHYPQYLKTRGLTAYHLWCYQVGVCFGGDYRDRAVFPVRINGTCRGFVARDLTGFSRRKVLYPSVMEVSSVVYNFDRAFSQVNGKPVVVVEGVMDVVRVEAAGYPAVAVLGSSVSKVQATLLSAFPRLVAMPDRDKSGNELVYQLLQRKLDRGRDLRLGLLPQGDPGEADVSTIQEVVESAVKVRARG